MEKDGNWGAINTRGKIVIPIDYEALGVLAGDKISACKIMPNINNAIRCGYIDKKEMRFYLLNIFGLWIFLKVSAQFKGLILVGII